MLDLFYWWCFSFFPVGFFVAGAYAEYVAYSKTRAQNLFVMLLCGGITFAIGILYYFYKWLGRFK